VSAPAPNTVIDNRYKVLRRLGSGGMADVFLADDEQLGRQVALKLLHGRFAADPDFVERFRREARAAAGLQHPNVVSVYDRGSWDDTYYIAMEYLPGRSLKQLIRDEAPLDPVRAIDITLQILKAARFAHRRGVIHRDLKPHNVIIDSSDHAKVTDFGIARAGASDMTETGSIMGTAQYLSPEQAQGHAVEGPSDLYSIGIVLYEMLTARVPFDAESAVTIALKHVSEPPVPPSQLNPAVPGELEQVVMWVLNKNPADRPADADQLIAALEHARGNILDGRPGENTASLAAVGGAGAAPGLAGGAVALGAAELSEPYPDRHIVEHHPEEEPPEGERAWLPWLIGLLILLLIAGAAVAAYLVSRPAQEKVPAVTGLQLNVARTILQNANFQVGPPINVPSSQPPGIVIGEDPSGGSMADKNSTISLSVSQGPSKVTIPSVVGQSEAAARAQLRRAHLNVRVVSRPSSQIPSGQAMGTDPGSGASVAPGTEVSLFISSGKPLAQVPDVTGQSRAAASAALSNAGFKVQVTTQTSSSAAPGSVISQDPSGGAQASAGSTVTIVVATPPKMVSVPSVIGETAGAATGDLTGAGFKVVKQTKRVTNRANNGIVLSQHPGGGGKAKPGSTVTIVVGAYQSSKINTTTSTTTTNSTSPTSTSKTGSAGP
jgi:beta-lactam-binding protein with PASTA domain